MMGISWDYYGMGYNIYIYLSKFHHDLVATEAWNHGLFEGNHPLLWPNYSEWNIVIYQEFHLFNSFLHIYHISPRRGLSQISSNVSRVDSAGWSSRKNLDRSFGDGFSTRATTHKTDPAGAGRKMRTLIGGFCWWDPWHTIFFAAPLGFYEPGLDFEKVKPLPKKRTEKSTCPSDVFCMNVSRNLRP